MMTEYRPYLLLAIATLVLSGCIPWAVPPMKIEGSIGPKVVIDNGADITGTANIRAGIVPVLPRPKMLVRPVDGAIGWQLIPTFDGRWHHGPFLEAGYFFHTIPQGPRDAPLSAWRFGVHGRGFPLLGLTEADLGLGAAVQVSADWASFHSGPIAGAQADNQGLGIFMGWSAGEQGLGGFAELGYATLFDESWNWIALGITIRNPAAAGILIGIPWGLFTR